MRRTQRRRRRGGQNGETFRPSFNRGFALSGLRFAPPRLLLPAHFPFFCAASASVTRAPRRMVESIVLPSWQAHS